MNNQEQIINRLALRIAQLEVDLSIALAQIPVAGTDVEPEKGDIE